MAYINAQKAYQDMLYDLKYGNVNVGGGKTRRQYMAEAATIEQIINWFHTIYKQIDARVETAKTDNNVDLEALYRKVRSMFRDYEPRVGDQMEVVIKRIGYLHDEMKVVESEYTGSIGGYVKALTHQLERILAKEAPEGIADEAPAGEESETPAEEVVPPETAPEIVPEE